MQDTICITNVQGQLRLKHGQLRERTSRLTNFQGQLQEREREREPYNSKKFSALSLNSFFEEFLRKYFK